MEPLFSYPFNFPTEQMSKVPSVGGGNVSETFSIGANFGSMVDLVINKAERNDTAPFLPKLEKPKRPLTAYNLFFRAERARMIGVKYEGTNHIKKKRLHRKTHGKIGFQEMAKVVGQKWQQLDPISKAFFQAEADKDVKRYRKDMEVYKQTCYIMGLHGQRLPSKTSCSWQQDSIRLPQGNSSTLYPVPTEGSAPPPPIGTPNGQHTPVHLKTTLTQALELCQAGKQKACEDDHQTSNTESQCHLENNLRDALESDVFDFSSNIQEIQDSISHPPAPANKAPAKSHGTPRIDHDFEAVAMNVVDPFDGSTAFDKPNIVSSLERDFEPLDASAETYDEGTFFLSTLKREFVSVLEQPDPNEPQRARRKTEHST